MACVGYKDVFILKHDSARIGLHLNPQEATLGF